MLKLSFDKITKSSYTVLCLGAHSDDIEIGCGGTILKLTNTLPDAHIYWIVFASHREREREASQSAHNFLTNAKDTKIIIKNFRDGFFPYIGLEIKEYFENLKREISPDLIFTHFRDDLHQDHRLISELTWNTFRDNVILEYEIPKYDGDLGSPNFYVHLDESICRRKIAHILSSFETQKNKQWFTEDTFLSILRLRGIEANAASRYAEAFYCRKLVY